MTGAAPRRRPAVFLDRDGVVNQPIVAEGRPRSPASVEDFVLLPMVGEACERLRAAGLLLVVVTNQPEVARGTLAAETLEAMHQLLHRRVSVDAVLTCPHDDGDGCDCRKPAPGLLLQAARTWQVEMGQSVMVGDRWRDVEAGRAAGCATVWVRHRYRERFPASPDLTVNSLFDAVPWILRHSGCDRGVMT
ncbi:MAG: HAD family hydrolase [Candidatus Dormibacteraeota bacterium]|nr:HAD family hydrolase [Candidatus Dormibacteraeota bacterium]